MVHIGVKLKARMLKPSNSLYFSIIVKLYGKEKQGLRVRDLDHRDKQNFDDVLNLIKASATCLMLWEPMFMSK